MKITKLTSGGRVNGFPIDGSTSISPEGKYVVFTLNEAGEDQHVGAPDLNRKRRANPSGK